VFEARACSILYNVLCTLRDSRPFLLPANVCPIVPITFLKAGQPFSFVDIAASEWTMDKDSCLRALKRSPKGLAGVLFVRTYGAERDENQFFAMLKGRQPDLLVIDDRCLCRPICEEKDLVSSADITLFSTGHAKHVDLGFGGFAHLTAEVSYGRHESDFSEEVLIETTKRYKLAFATCSSFESADESWLDVSRPDMSWRVYRRKVADALRIADQQKLKMNALYQELLPAEIQMPSDFQRWRFNIRIARPDEVVERLFREGLFASRHFQAPTGVFCSGRFEQTETLHSEVVNLFNDRYYDDDKAVRTAKIISAHVD
jgi:hypothetical protein